MARITAALRALVLPPLLGQVAQPQSQVRVQRPLVHLLAMGQVPVHLPAVDRVLAVTPLPQGLAVFQAAPQPTAAAEENLERKGYVLDMFHHH